jgi:hypothetical protein
VYLNIACSTREIWLSPGTGVTGVVGITVGVDVGEGLGADVAVGNGRGVGVGVGIFTSFRPVRVDV